MASQFTMLNGIKVTIRERNEQMKMEYIRGAEINELSERYSLSTDTLNDIRRKDKWVPARKAYRADTKLYADGKIKQLYAGHKVHVNVKYNLAWQKLMNIVEMCLDDPNKYLIGQNGQPKWGAISSLADVIQKAQEGQATANGNMPAEVALNLEIQLEKLTILREQSGIEQPGAEDVVKDNFTEALDNAAKVVWADFQQLTAKDIEKAARHNKL